MVDNIFTSQNSFVFTQLNGFKYYYWALKILLDFSILFVHRKVVLFCLVLWHINHFRLLIPNPFLNINSSISNNSKIDLFQAIQFSISTQFSSIWFIDRTLLDATTPSQSELGSDANERVLHIPQSSSISGASPSDCFVGGFLPLCRDTVSVF